MRDYEAFPDDARGDKLWEMHCAGEDLSRPRPVCFRMAFNSEEQAEAFLQVMQEAAYRSSLCEYSTEHFVSWEVEATTHIVPSHARITAHAELLATLAAEHGGIVDDWDAESCPGQDDGAEPGA